MDPTDPNDPNDPQDPVTPDHLERDYDDVAAVVGASAYAGELTAMLDVLQLSTGGVPDGFSVQQGDHFQVATGARSGVSFQYLYHCNDDADVILVTCSGYKNHAHVTVNIAGDATGAAMSMEGIARDGDWTVRDLGVDKPRVGGDAHMAFTARVTGDNPATFDLTYDANFDRVRFSPAGGFPLSGKIDLSIGAERTRGDDHRTFGMIGAIQFAGNSSATITLDASHTYALDLTTGAVVQL